MQWRETCIILASKPFSENFRRVTVFNASIGKTSGLIRGMKTPIHQGDVSNVIWKGRTSEQLGTLQIENIFSPFTYVFNNPIGILAIDAACTLCLNGMPEKAPHPKLLDTLHTLLLLISKCVIKDWLKEFSFFELNFLSEVGYGLDLSKCAVTEKTDGLCYLSPRTGRAVTKYAGEKYKDKLFKLPEFLTSKNKFHTLYDIFCALQITEHFLKMYFYDINSKELPLARGYLVEWLKNKILEQENNNVRNDAQ